MPFKTREEQEFYPKPNPDQRLDQKELKNIKTQIKQEKFMVNTSQIFPPSIARISQSILNPPIKDTDYLRHLQESSVSQLSCYNTKKYKRESLYHPNSQIPTAISGNLPS